MVAKIALLVTAFACCSQSANARDGVLLIQQPDVVNQFRRPEPEVKPALFPNQVELKFPKIEFPVSFTLNHEIVVTNGVIALVIFFGVCIIIHGVCMVAAGKRQF